MIMSFKNTQEADQRHKQELKQHIDDLKEQAQRRH